jgi:glyoxylase-like metal-dependent hydrolase (beta-lactamase superfamily II)
VTASGADVDGLVQAERAGIHRLAIPTPFLVGRVNCYLIDDEPLTLVDTGPNSGKALDELEQGLAQLGHRIEDLELIILTHQHVDHLGLFSILQRRSGAHVAGLDALGPYLDSFSASANADDEFAEQLMRRHGVPDDLATALRAVGMAFRSFGASGKIDRPLHDGELLRFRDRTLRVLHRPGHSPSDTLLFDERTGMMLGGDHLLGHISSNPLISRPLDGSPVGSDTPDRPRALLQYMNSMRQTREMPIELVLPGHGDPVGNHVALIDERFRMHERRARKIRKLLAGGPMTAYEVAHTMWGNVAVTQAFLTISEVLGHMDLLVQEGCIAESAEEDAVRFSPVGS